ncbi:MAG TPA: tetratricopeptide repeat protein [Polyangiaceae bacterium]
MRGRRDSWPWAALVAAVGVALGLFAFAFGFGERQPSTRAGEVRVVGVHVAPSEVVAGEASRVTAVIERGGAADLRYVWRTPNGGTIEGEGASVRFRPPARVGTYAVLLEVRSGAERSAGKAVVRVRLPSPKLVRTDVRARAPGPAAPSEDTLARIGELERELASAPAPGAPALDFIAARHRKIELAGLLNRSGRYEEALVLYAELIAGLAADDPNSRPYRAGFARAALALGREEEALAAFEDAGPGSTSKADQYAMGTLLEKRGRVDEALDAYARAMNGNVAWPTDTLFRRTALLVEEGRAGEAIDLLVGFSPVRGRDAILDRLNDDPEMSGVLAALKKSGRSSELEDERPVDPKSLPGAEPRDERPRTVVHPPPGEMKGYAL